MELYLDLVAMFVSMLERSALFAGELDSTFLIFDEEGHETDAGIYIGYDFEKPELTIAWSTDEWPKASPLRVVVSPEQPHEFAQAFKIMFLLLQLDHFVSAGYLRRVLSEAPGEL